MKLHYEVTINRPIVEVFDFLVTNFPGNFPKISKDTVMVNQSPQGPIREGTLLEVINATYSTHAMIITETKGKLPKIEFEESKPYIDANLKGSKQIIKFQVIGYELNKSFVLCDAREYYNERDVFLVQRSKRRNLSQIRL